MKMRITIVDGDFFFVFCCSCVRACYDVRWAGKLGYILQYIQKYLVHYVHFLLLDDRFFPVKMRSSSDLGY